MAEDHRRRERQVGLIADAPLGGDRAGGIKERPPSSKAAGSGDTQRPPAERLEADIPNGKVSPKATT